MSNIFEQASRQQLRFETIKGTLSVEDLWELPLTSTTGKACLDGIAIALHKQLRASTDVVSFVDSTATQDPAVQLRFDLVKHIIETRKAENAEAANAKAKAETKQQILAALDRKRAGAIEAMSEEQLKQMLAGL